MKDNVTSIWHLNCPKSHMMGQLWLLLIYFLLLCIRMSWKKEKVSPGPAINERFSHQHMEVFSSQFLPSVYRLVVDWKSWRALCFGLKEKILLTTSPILQTLSWIHSYATLVSFAIYTVATLRDTPAVVLQNRLGWHCTTGALHNKMRITLRVFYGAIWSKSARLSALRRSSAAVVFLSSLFTFLCTAVKSQAKRKCFCEEVETWKTLGVSLVPSRHSTDIAGKEIAIINSV